jgi:hypothetical protein
MPRIGRIQITGHDRSPLGISPFDRGRNGAGVWSPSNTNNLHRQTALSAPIDHKERSKTLANPNLPGRDVREEPAQRKNRGVGTHRERPPDSENRSPGAAGTATGAKLKSKSKLQRRSTKGNGEPQVVGHHSFALTHRQDTAGFIEQEGKTFAATAASDRRALGVFRTLEEACDAISAARRGEQ